MACTEHLCTFDPIAVQPKFSHKGKINDQQVKTQRRNDEVHDACEYCVYAGIALAVEEAVE